MSTQKKAAKAKAKAKPAAKSAKPAKTKMAAKPAKTAPKPTSKTKKPAPKKPAPAPKKAAPSPAKKIAKTPTVTAKKTPEKPKASENPKAIENPKSAKTEKAPVASPTPSAAAPQAAPASPAPAKKPARTTLDDLALDIEEKDELLEEEKRDLAKALRDDEDEPLETAFVPTDTSERLILVVDEEGQRRNETVTIVSQILPNAVIEVADDPEEALEVMGEADFDTYVVNFLMPGFSASPFVKAVANHPDHPLLIGFAADKISDALDQRKGLKIIPLKRLFDLDVNAAAEPAKDKPSILDD